MVTLVEAATFLAELDDVLILSHQYPDGDTLGSACALCRALQKLGKRAAAVCSHVPGQRYAFLREGVRPQEFTPRTVVAVDVAAPSLLGEPLLSRYGGRVDLCLDHHTSGVEYARLTYVDAGASAAAEIVYRLLPLLGVALDPYLAACIYTGISTDTGGFRFPNMTSDSLRIAAEMMDAGADAVHINRVLIEAKSRGFMELERLALDSMAFFYGDRCAVITLTREMLRACSVRDEEIDAIPALPRQVEGVLAGVTIREKENGDFRVSVRTQPGVNAARICERLGGGGHRGAAGCTCHRAREGDPYAAAVHDVVAAVGDYFRKKHIIA